MRIRSAKEQELGFGDIIKVLTYYYLLTPHPEDENKFYLVTFDGDFFGGEPMTETEVFDYVTCNRGEIFRKAEWHIDLTHASSIQR